MTCCNLFDADAFKVLVQIILQSLPSSAPTSCKPSQIKFISVCKASSPSVNVFKATHLSVRYPFSFSYSHLSIFLLYFIRKFSDVEQGISMDYLRMDGKRGHVTCGNRSAIERQESFQKFASFEEELLFFSGLLGPYKISHGLTWGKMTPAR